MIESVIEDVVARTSASVGDNLTGFSMDLDHALFQSGLVNETRIIRTGDDLSMLNVHVSLSPDLATLSQVSGALQRVLADIAYKTFHAAAFAYYSDTAVMRFVTAVPDKGLRITGTVLVSGAAYAETAKSSPTALSPLPGGLPAWAA